MESSFVYTIGHSTHPAERLVELLRLHEITAVADVRSRPYSRFNPQFNRETLRDGLVKAGIAYVFLGHQLGGRPDDPGCYEEGGVRYDRVAATAAFRAGLERIRRGVRERRVTLMCAERDPLTCHRAILVCRRLAAAGIDARHIHDDGRLESHEEALERLLGEEGIARPQLFRTREEMIEEAYSRRAVRMAGRKRARPCAT